MERLDLQRATKAPPLQGVKRRAELMGLSNDALEIVRGIIGPDDELAPGMFRDLRRIDGQLTLATGRLRERLIAPGLTGAQLLEASEAISEMHGIRFLIHDFLTRERLRRLEVLEIGLMSLRMVHDQDQLVEMMCSAVSDCCEFDRVLLSKVDRSMWRPWKSYTTSELPTTSTMGAWIREVPQIQLRLMPLEREVVRTRTPAIVRDCASDDRIYRPLVEMAGLTSYVAAPILPNGRVIGLIHADYEQGEVTQLDRDILWAFAVAFGQILERAALLARLLEQRAELLQAIRVVEGAVEAISSVETDLVSRVEPAFLHASRSAARDISQTPGRLDLLLTIREREVLNLMSTGATNERISQQLFIALNTVKSHVKNILRKLEAENRVEAISLLLRQRASHPDD